MWPKPGPVALLRGHVACLQDRSVAGAMASCRNARASRHLRSTVGRWSGGDEEVRDEVTG